MAFFIIIFDQFLSRSQLEIGIFSNYPWDPPPLTKWPFSGITNKNNLFEKVFRTGYLVSLYAKELTLPFLIIYQKECCNNHHKLHYYHGIPIHPLLLYHI